MQPKYFVLSSPPVSFGKKVVAYRHNKEPELIPLRAKSYTNYQFKSCQISENQIFQLHY